jgi:hypothetical protein
MAPYSFRAIGLGLISALASTALAPPTQADGASKTGNDLLIKSIHRASGGSGYLMLLHRWSVETQAGVAMDLFSVSLGEQDPLPRPGQRCDVRYHMEQTALKTDAPFRLVEDFTCAPTSNQSAAPNL